MIVQVISEQFANKDIFFTLQSHKQTQTTTLRCPYNYNTIPITSVLPVHNNIYMLEFLVELYWASLSAAARTSSMFPTM